MEVAHHGYRMLVPDSESWSDAIVAKMLLRAYEKYRERNAERKGVWARCGVRGQVYNVFSKAERAMFDVDAGEVPDEDHMIDAIIYAAFALVLGDKQTSVPFDRSDRLNGSWPWTSSRRL